MRTVWHTLDRLLNVLKVLGAICLVAMMALTCADVIGRYFNHPIFGSVEIVGFLSTLCIALALPYTHRVRGHIGVEILVHKLSDRMRWILDLFTGCMTLGLIGLIAWRMMIYANTMRNSGEVSMNLEFPEHVIIYVVAFCFLVFGLIVLQDMIHNFRFMKQRK
jgi:TRAP-type C4-dicarboxylate transport system permease small subunit